MLLIRRTLLTLPLLLAMTAHAQMTRIPFSGGFSGGADHFEGNASFSFGSRTTVPLWPNGPYYAEPKSESVQTLADGTHITNSRLMPHGVKVWRDSQGRSRIEESIGGGGRTNPNYPTLVQIEDPVSGYIYILDNIHKEAHRLKAPAAPARSLDPSISTPRQASAPQDLGNKTIDGVMVHGTRIARVIPTGTVGNDGPLTTTTDTWFSPELNLVIQTVTTDLRSGVQTEGFQNFSRNEPDPTLFLVPADYQIVDETGSFTIKWNQ